MNVTSSVLSIKFVNFFSVLRSEISVNNWMNYGNLTKADLLKRCNAPLTEMESTKRNGSGKISQ